jgi:hypothetical protein
MPAALIVIGAANQRVALTKGLEISRDGLELVHHGTRRRPTPPVCGNIKAMIHMVMDQLPFCLRNGFLNGMKLLGKVKACPAFIEHRYHSPDVPFGPLQPLDDIRMAFMELCFRLHAPSYPTGRDMQDRATIVLSLAIPDIPRG